MLKQNRLEAPKKWLEEKEDHYILIQGLMSQENVTVIIYTRPTSED